MIQFPNWCSRDNLQGAFKLTLGYCFYFREIHVFYNKKELRNISCNQWEKIFRSPISHCSGDLMSYQAQFVLYDGLLISYVISVTSESTL